MALAPGLPLAHGTHRCCYAEGRARSSVLLVSLVACSPRVAVRVPSCFGFGGHGWTLKVGVKVCQGQHEIKEDDMDSSN